MCDDNDGLFGDCKNIISGKFRIVQFSDTAQIGASSSNEETDYDSDENFKYTDESANTTAVISDETPSNHAAEKSFGKNANTTNVDRCYPKGHTVKLIDNKNKLVRASAEQVTYPDTRMILFKLFLSGIINVINRPIISTGKEANVYHASSKDGNDYAIKIYKASISVFHDKENYVSGEHKYDRGYCESNPREMARTLAEKETRNLVRLFNANLNVPEPITLHSHVLVMSFIGDQGRPAPKLKDLTMSQLSACLVYKDCIMIMWKMFNICKLVHADLSEYNLLYHQGDVVVTDVSQSVEHDHPNALEFLRKDCTNISSFFRKKEIPTLTVKELFDFVTDSAIDETNVKYWLEQMTEMASKRNLEEVTCQEQFEEEVFRNTYIPKLLTKHDEEYSRFWFETSARPRDETSDAKKARKRAAKKEKRRTKEAKHIIKRKHKRHGEK